MKTVFFFLVWTIMGAVAYSSFCLYSAIFYWIHNNPSTDIVLMQKYMNRGIVFLILTSVLIFLYVYIAKNILKGSGFLN